MENGGKKIRKIKFYQCGYCENNIGHILKNVQKEKLQFPALVVLIEHEKFGNILYDTGYSEEVYNNGLISFLYNLLNKTYITEEENIVTKLKKDNVKKIQKIILSHAHPDHIGGLKFFEDYELITTKEVWETMNKIKIKNLVFRNLVPKTKNFSLKIVEKKVESFLQEYFEEVYDILGDGSILGVKLEGHSAGQLGIYLPEFKKFFVADTTWGQRFLNQIENMQKIAQFIQKDYKEYCKTAERIRDLKKDFPEIEIIFSHEKYEEKIYE